MTQLYARGFKDDREYTRAEQAIVITPWMDKDSEGGKITKFHGFQSVIEIVALTRMIWEHWAKSETM